MACLRFCSEAMWLAFFSLSVRRGFSRLERLLGVPWALSVEGGVAAGDCMPGLVSLDGGVASSGCMLVWASRGGGVVFEDFMPAIDSNDGGVAFADSLDG